MTDDVEKMGGRDELNAKLRLRDDEIDRLRARIAALEAERDDAQEAVKNISIYASATEGDA